MSDKYLIVGLGNPGRKYKANRHNIGFMAVDEIVRRHGFGPFRGRFQSDISEGRIGGEKLLAQKPLQYMNRSGPPVKSAADFYKLEPEEIIVIYDEIELAPGKVFSSRTALDEARRYRADAAARGLDVVAFQAILFGDLDKKRFLTAGQLIVSLD